MHAGSVLPNNPPSRRMGASVCLACLLAAGAVVTPAAAEGPPCAAREAMLDQLASQFNEHPISVAVTDTGSLLEVLASPYGTWSVIVTLPGGPSCMVFSGDGWRGAPTQIADEPQI